MFPCLSEQIDPTLLKGTITYRCGSTKAELTIPTNHFASIEKSPKEVCSLTPKCFSHFLK